MSDAVLEAARARLAGSPDDPAALRAFAEAARDAGRRDEGVATVRRAYLRKPTREVYALLREICTFPEFQDVDPPEKPPPIPPVSEALAKDRIEWKPYALLLDQILFYPVRSGTGIFVLVSGALLVSVAQLKIGGCLTGIVNSYLAVYLWSVLRESAYGGRSNPGWPDFESFFDIVRAYLRWLMVTLGCFGPFLFVILSGHTWLHIAAASVLLLAGAFYFPMALLVVGFSENGFNVINAPVVFGSIRRIARDYFICVGFVVGSYIASIALEIGLRFAMAHSPAWLAILFMIRALNVYMLILQMRAIGLLYFVRSKDLGW